MYVVRFIAIGSIDICVSSMYMYEARLSPYGLIDDICEGRTCGSFIT